MALKDNGFSWPQFFGEFGQTLPWAIQQGRQITDTQRQQGIQFVKDMGAMAMKTGNVGPGRDEAQIDMAANLYPALGREYIEQLYRAQLPRVQTSDADKWGYGPPITKIAPEYHQKGHPTFQWEINEDRGQVGGSWINPITGQREWIEGSETWTGQPALTELQWDILGDAQMNLASDASGREEVMGRLCQAKKLTPEQCQQFREATRLEYAKVEETTDAPRPEGSPGPAQWAEDVLTSEPLPTMLGALPRLPPPPALFDRDPSRAIRPAPSLTPEIQEQIIDRLGDTSEQRMAQEGPPGLIPSRITREQLAQPPAGRPFVSTPETPRPLITAEPTDLPPSVVDAQREVREAMGQPLPPAVPPRVPPPGRGMQPDTPGQQVLNLIEDVSPRWLGGTGRGLDAAAELTSDLWSDPGGTGEQILRAVPEGLGALTRGGIDRSDIDKFLGTIEERLEAGRDRPWTDPGALLDKMGLGRTPDVVKYLRELMGEADLTAEPEVEPQTAVGRPENRMASATNSALAQHGMDPAVDGQLVAALMNVESGGRHVGRRGKVITGGKGELGAFQLLPAAVTDAERALGRQFDPSILEDNITVGTWYLNQMLRNPQIQRGGGWRRALAAYNAGPSGGVPQSTQEYVSKIEALLSPEVIAQLDRKYPTA